jgi:O-succinylhomoserine sulfhydrylase
LKAGDHVICSNAVFGATIQLFNTILGRFGVETSFVPTTRIDAWEKAVRKNTRLLFVETPSNPLTEISDLAALSRVAKSAGALLAVDNVFCTPVLQKPLALGADIVVHSATKYIDGQGRVMGGAVCGSRALVGDPMTVFLRTAGPTLSPFNAWVLLKGLETLDLRVRAQSAAALELARWLEGHPSVARVHYPGLPSHPQHELAKRQQRAGGAIVSFEVKGGKEAAWRLIDATRLVSITGNLGDVKTTITHPATTTHGRISADARAAAGISDGLIRLSVGLEAVEDLRNDLQRGLA